MEVTKKMALPLILVLFLAATFAYAAEANQAEPAITEAPAPPERLGFIFDEAYIAELLEKVKADDPNKAQKLEKLRQENPRLFQVEMRKIAWQYKEPREGLEPGPFHRGGPMQDTEGGPMRGREMLRDRFHNMEAELISWLEKNEPQTAKELAALKEKDPRAYMRRLSIETKKYREIIDAEQTNPALAELLKKDLGLKQKRNELLEKYKAATDAKQKKELMTQLKEVTSERFDLILQKKQLKYEELKKKLEELQKNVNSSQAELENYKKNKDELIKKHLDDLINQSGQFDWD
ncbi:MAG: hypothetical protein ABSE89_08100 [Sedimentisphaerales bacterium]